jgi:hypothetical protein
MIRSFAFALFALLIAAATAQAGVVTYAVTVDTSGLSGPGYIEFQFNQASSTTSLSAVADIIVFRSTGFTFDDLLSGGTAGTSGSRTALPISIPNDAGAANYYDIGITSWGTGFTIGVRFSGAAVGGTAGDPSGFYVFLLDSSFSPIVSPLSAGEIASVTINTDGSSTPASSSFSGGGASTFFVPEPGSLLLFGSGLGLAALRLRRR